MSEQKKGDNEPIQQCPKTPLIDVIRRLSPYMPESRFSKWRTRLAEEDLDYLTDLMIIPKSAFSASRFSMRLYGELLRITELQMIQMIITDDPKNHQISVRKGYEGTYIDIGDRMNDQTVFIKVNGGKGMNDLNQKIIYCHSDGLWRFYCVSNSNNGHYMIKSNETVSTHFDKMTWVLGNGSKDVPMKIKIKAWNL